MIFRLMEIALWVGTGFNMAKHNYVAVISLIILNLLVVIVDMAYSSIDWISEADWDEE